MAVLTKDGDYDVGGWLNDSEHYLDVVNPDRRTAIIAAIEKLREAKDDSC